MNDSDRLVAQDACLRLMNDYTHLADGFGDRSAVAALFTDDAVWESNEARAEGRDELEAMFSATTDEPRTSRHVASNMTVTMTGDESATGLSYFTLYRHIGAKPSVPDLDDQPIILGSYHDDFRLTADGWRIAHRRAEVGFVRRSAFKK